MLKDKYSLFKDNKCRHQKGNIGFDQPHNVYNNWSDISLNGLRQIELTTKARVQLVPMWSLHNYY